MSCKLDKEDTAKPKVVEQHEIAADIVQNAGAAKKVLALPEAENP